MIVAILVIPLLFAIDIDGFFATHWKGNFPEWIQFGTTGSFEIQGDNFRLGGGAPELMTSLRGCPKIVNGEFNCSRQDLKNLVGGPETVRGHYSCSMNPHLKSFEGIAKLIGGDFACNNKSGLTEKDIPEGTDILGNTNVHYWAQW